MIYHAKTHISCFYSESSGRFMPIFFMRERSVSGCISRICAAPLGPLIRQNAGTRISDTLKIKHSDLQGEKIILKEKKTKKVREITLNTVVKKAYQKLTDKLNEINFKYDENDFVFVSQKGTVYRTQSINIILKKVFNSKNLQISSHSLRKSFSRKIYDNMNNSEYALVLLSDILSHSNLAITRRYKYKVLLHQIF